MATVTTRIDDKLKSEAENVADEIGIPLSTAINIFLKRFIAENGFPFDVVSHAKMKSIPIVDTKVLDESIKRAIADPNNIEGISSHQITYLDPQTKKLFKVN